MVLGHGWFDFAAYFVSYKCVQLNVGLGQTLSSYSHKTPLYSSVFSAPSQMKVFRIKTLKGVLFKQLESSLA